MSKSLPKPKKFATIDTSHCVACGCCVKVCKREAISIPNGVFALINPERCVGCGFCVRECPASVITISSKIFNADTSNAQGGYCK